jgi:fructose-specific phosphotransferase system component IIB
MMELVRFGLINWYLASREDIDVAGNIAILGKNRSGKSSLLDMAQVVLTGYNKNVQRLNASAGDGKHKKSERSIFAYCQGTYGDGSTVRRHGTTIIFLGFQDPKTDRAITIGIALEFDGGDSAERLLGRFIVPGAVLSTELFIQKTADGREIVKDWATIKAALERASKGTLFDNSSESFIKNWTKLASTGRRSISPARLMKALVNAISFEEIQSATQFVRDYVLAKDPLDIAQLKTSIKTYHDLHKKIIDLREQLAVADDIIEKAKAHARHIRSRENLRGAASALAYASARSIYFVNFNGARKQRALEAKLTEEIQGIDANIGTTDSDLGDVNDLINAALNNNDRLILSQQKKTADAERGFAEKALNELYTEAAKLFRATHHASKHEPLGEIQNPLSGIGQSLQAAQHPNWPKDISALLGAVEQIGGLSSATIAQLQKRLDQEARRRAKIEDRLQEIREAIENLRTHGVAITSQTSRFLAALKSRGMDPKILCQLVEITDESWRDAAEIMLGRDREAVIVDARHATAAKEFLRAHRTEFHGVRVVGTDKEDWKDSHHRSDSLAAIIATDHPDARILVDKRLGSLRRADDIQELKRAGRAVLRDGTYDDGIVVETRRVEGGRKIGTGAADGPSLQAEGGSLEIELAKVRSIETDLRGAVGALNTFSGYDRAKADAIITAYGNAVEKVAGIVDQIRSLDANIDPALAERKNQLESQLKSLRDERDVKSKELGRAAARAESYEEKLAESELSQGSRAFVAVKRKDFRHAIRQAERGEAFRLAREIVGKVSRNSNQLLNASNDAWTRADAARDMAEKTQIAIFDQIIDFNVRWQSASGLSRSQSSIEGDVLPYFENLAKQIRESDLVAHEQLARDAAESTRGMFQTSFVASLSDKITRLGDEVDRLNRILAEHKFHEERYSFRAVKAAQYEDIIEFVKLAREDDTLMLKILDPEDDTQSGAAGVINRILMDENFDFSGFEDYRQYFIFDILMRNDAEKTEVNLEKRKGIGSGAERQVPFYVAIGAALSAAWHGSKAERERNVAGIGLALFDEAFSKMDSSNQRACIQFYNNLGLQTVIAAPPEKQAIALANMNTIVNVSRDGRHVEFDLTKVKDQTHATIAANDPASLTPADVRAMLAARAATSETGVNGQLNGSTEKDIIVNGTEPGHDVVIAEAHPITNPGKLEDLKP